MLIPANVISQPIYLVLGAVVVSYLNSQRRFSAYASIPAVGHTLPLLSFLTAIQFALNPLKFIEEGYTKYRDGVFRIPLFGSWRVVVTGPKLIDELRRAKDDELSFAEAVATEYQQRLTMGKDTVENMYHVDIIRNEFTKNMKTILPEIHDELEACFAEYIPPTDGWTPVTAMEKVLQIIARASGRVFVGAPVCRNPEYIDLSISYTTTAMLGGKILGMLPPYIRELAARWIAPRKLYIDKMNKLIGPLVEERRRNMELHGKDWADKPNDLLQWLMEYAKDDQDLAQRMLTTTIAAIHTSSMTFTSCLYRLAAHPEHAALLREEIYTILAEDDEGWTREALQKMSKLDSFIKECQRLHGFSTLIMERMAMKDFTFSDGTFIPKGAVVCAASYPTHMESEHYPDPFTFDPWRFSRVRGAEGKSTVQMATTARVDYLSFGYGRHACPGRFFAVAEMKMMLAQVLLNYDVKMEEEGVVPKHAYFQQQSPPSYTAKVLFRKRQV